MSLVQTLKSIFKSNDKLDPKNIFTITKNNDKQEVTIKNEDLFKNKRYVISNFIFEKNNINNNTKLVELITAESYKTYFTDNPIPVLYLEAYLLNLPMQQLGDIYNLMGKCNDEHCKSQIITNLLVDIDKLWLEKNYKNKQIVNQIYIHLLGNRDRLTNEEAMILQPHRIALSQSSNTTTRVLQRYNLKPNSIRIGGSKRKTNIRKHKRKTQKRK